jgi:hypothetical protein
MNTTPTRKTFNRLEDLLTRTTTTHRATRVALRRLRGALVSAVLVCSAAAAASPASALTGPAWQIDSLASSQVAPGQELRFSGDASNVGDQITSGEIELRVTLPAGITAVAITAFNRQQEHLLTCTAGDGSSPVEGASVVLCHDPGQLPPSYGTGGAHEAHELFVLNVRVSPGVADGSHLVTRFSVSGGGAAPAEFDDPTLVTNTPAEFGLDAFDGQVTADATGFPSSAAAATPFAASTTVAFSSRSSSGVRNPVGGFNPTEPDAPVKDISVDLPPGFVGVPAGLPQCTPAQLEPHPPNNVASCPADSQVGTVTLQADSPAESKVTALSIFGTFVRAIPLYNMVPPHGAPARFGFEFSRVTALLTARLHAGAQYSISVDSHSISQGLSLAGVTVTLWGVPADPGHDSERSCPFEGGVAGGGVAATSPQCVDEHGAPLYVRPPLRAFLRNPTSCSGPLTTSVHVDSWSSPGSLTSEGAPNLADPAWKSASFVSHSAPGYPALPEEWGSPLGITGCAQVPFEPSVSVIPTAHTSSSPSGLDVTISTPQTTDPSVIGEADLKKTVVTLPEGFTVNPSSANGLGACSPAQIGLGSVTAPSCPDDSKLGTVEVQTPLLDHMVPGSVYLARQSDNPFGTLIALYLVLNDPVSGTVVKLPGRVDLNQSTGRLTITFDDSPQLPFEMLKLHMFDGPRAALSTPVTCGSYTTDATLNSWAQPDVGVPLESQFAVTGGPGGGACPADASHLPFAPSFSGGSVSTAAGAFSPFSFSFSRGDGEQSLSSLTLVDPPGQLADIASVPRCGEADAAAGTCPAGSQLGSVLVGSGSGPEPVFLPGKIFLTTGYEGAPFGEEVDVPAIAGPFNLGNVVVRGKVTIDPTTAQVVVVSDPFPTMLQGIPVDMRRVDVHLDRPGLEFTPTSCDPEAVTGSLTSTQGSVVPFSTRFQVGGCSGLKFNPSFTVSTLAHTSKQDGASLHVHLATGQGPSANGGGEANIAKVDVQLPLSLPSRLPTLQKACTEAQFNTNPAGCPEASFVGTAVARTPVLSNPLTGPAILVSHGGAAFPDLVLLLQGEGITLDLVGNTQIKNGITYSRFDTVPDAPVSSFDLELPEGPHSILAATGSLCQRTVRTRKRVTVRVHGRLLHRTRTSTTQAPTTLLMPTTITAQNGAVLNQNTKIAVAGCASLVKAKAKTKAKKKSPRKGKH